MSLRRKRARLARGLGRAFGLGFLLVAVGQGCLRPPAENWAAAVTDYDLEQALTGLPEEGAAALLPVSEIFYSRISSRRFNSRATFDDPSVRQFFPTVAAYSDYYAALVDALDRAFIENNRPTRVELIGVERTDAGTLQLELRFVGENDLPLRWWSAELVQEDEWVWRDNRWFVVPGKV